MHSFSYGHHDQRRYVLRACTNDEDDDDVAQYGACTGQPMHVAYASAI